MLTVSIMLAYNTPALWKRLGHRAGSWFQSSEEAMMEEDAMDEAAMQKAASAATATTAALRLLQPAPAPAATTTAEERIQNVLTGFGRRRIGTQGRVGRRAVRGGHA